MGKVYLVGAGPGDAGLITVKGLEKIKKCDAIVYDRLASDELLDYTKEGCAKIYVGKEATKHYKKQEEINDILLECARKYEYVVRLKGGDPFVFGRGGEEIDVLTQEGIEYEVVPGVTSAVAVPECAGIPVTHRGVSRSFHVITGHTRSSVGRPDYDYETLAKLEGTIIFLMGLSNIADIAEHLMKAGKNPDTPAAVISNGTMVNQQTVRGTLENIAHRVSEFNMPSPAVIVIGDTAEYEYLYGSEINNAKYQNVKGSCNKKQMVGITATDMLWRRLKNGFKNAGMEPVSLCNMEVIKTDEVQELRSELHAIDTYQWVLFTSQNGVRIFFDEIKNEDIDMRLLGNVKFAVLGSGTAEKLNSFGYKSDFIPTRYTIPVMAEEFAQVIMEHDKVLIPRAVQGSLELNEIFDKYNISYKDIPIYDVAGHLTRNIKYLDDMDYLVFVSASGVTAFFQELRKTQLSLPEHIQIACIGDITSKQLRQECREADIVATVNNTQGLIEAVTGLV
jgi:uroporphyrinogen III methyltransferase/synthase